MVVTNAMPTTGTLLDSEMNVIEDGQRLEFPSARLEIVLDVGVMVALGKPFAAPETF